MLQPKRRGGILPLLSNCSGHSLVNFGARVGIQRFHYSTAKNPAVVFHGWFSNPHSPLRPFRHSYKTLRYIMEDGRVKNELIEFPQASLLNRNDEVPKSVPLIDLGSSDSSESSDSSDSDGDDATVSGHKRFRVSSCLEGVLSKKKKLDELGIVLPVGFLDPLPPEEPSALVTTEAQRSSTLNGSLVEQSCRLFWKAGEYEGSTGGDFDSSAGGLDHLRVHPKFLHSNATSHKWALGAFAELLDNSLDEICNGATYVNVDVVENMKDRNRMLLIEDNGGGMDPEKMRQCMSLGYSAKSKIANTIGQYGNGFKTSTMRLGADVIVFSRCCGKHGKSPTQSIGLLSYTFLRSTGKEDIVVPMIDYEKGGREWNKMVRSSASDWNKNLEMIMHWSPFSSESDLLQQFNFIKEHGTRIIIYNLWEDAPGQLELDFDIDTQDIQIRGVNRDEKNIQMAKEFPNSRHFLTYRHSLRSYASILYLRLPPGFRIILRGKDVVHHNLVNDMMMAQEITYRPQTTADGVPKDLNMVAVVTIGFVKDAKHHIDVQGFNVYHKNRLIKPFWRLWNAAGSDGRGVIGVLEANFVEPAHDKQGFERTIVLSRLETRLLQMQKTYWNTYCHKIGYAPRRNKKLIDESAREKSPDYLPQTPSQPRKKVGASGGKTPAPNLEKRTSHSNLKQGGRELGRTPGTVDHGHGNGHASSKQEKKTNMPMRTRKEQSSLEPSPPSAYDDDADMAQGQPEREATGGVSKASHANNSFGKSGYSSRSLPKEDDVNVNSTSLAIEQLREENRKLKERLKRKEVDTAVASEGDLEKEREKCKLLEIELQEARRKIEDMNKEQESLIDIFSEERERRDVEEENLRKKLKEASNTIQELLERVRVLEKMKIPNGKSDHR